MGVLLERCTDPLPDSGCRLYAGPLDPQGYPSPIRIDGHFVRPHRLACAWSYGCSTAEALALRRSVLTLHRCPGGARPSCCNPDCLTFGSFRMNMTDAIAEGTIPWAFGDGCCRNGHDVTLPDAIYVKPNGNRECRACQRQRGRRRSQAAEPVIEVEPGQMTLWP
jgi:hypothetical protein